MGKNGGFRHRTYCKRLPKARTTCIGQVADLPHDIRKSLFATGHWDCNIHTYTLVHKDNHTQTKLINTSILKFSKISIPAIMNILKLRLSLGSTLIYRIPYIVTRACLASSSNYMYH